MGFLKALRLKAVLEFIGMVVLYPLMLLGEKLGRLVTRLNTGKKRLTAGLLTVCLLLSMLPLSAITTLAADTRPPHDHCSCGLETDVCDTVYEDHHKDYLFPIWESDTRMPFGEELEPDESGGHVLSPKVYYYLVHDVDMSDKWEIQNGGKSCNITICLYDHTITNTKSDEETPVIYIWRGGRLYLTTCGRRSMDGDAEITHTEGALGSGVWVGAQPDIQISNKIGYFYFYGGNIVRNTSTTNGGGVWVLPDGKFEMYRGSISGNTAHGNGGGVYNTGVFNMYGGDISGNTASGQGDGVYNTNIFNMTGGTISSTGVAIENTGTLTISGGTVSGSRGIRNVDNGTVKLSGNPEISSNLGAADIDCCSANEGQIDADGYTGKPLKIAIDGTTAGQDNFDLMLNKVIVKNTTADQFILVDPAGQPYANYELVQEGNDLVLKEKPKAPEPTNISIYPYATAMTQSTSAGSMTLALELTGNTYQWQVSDAKDGPFTDIPEATGATYTFPTVHGKWYRCVLDGQKLTRPVQVLNASASDNFYRYNAYYWYLSNDVLAYSLNGKYGTFDIVGWYNEQWICTSYSGYWYVDARQTGSPAAVKGSSFDDTGVEALTITFDPDDERRAVFSIDLHDGYRAAAFGADTQLYESDYCPLTAKELRNGTLRQIQMVGANSLEDATPASSAFVIRPITAPSSYWIGYYSYRKGYTYNSDAALLNNSFYTFDRTGTYVTQVNAVDSGMTMSWTDVPSGGTVQFEMSIGTVQQTGAILQDPVTDTDAMELVVTPGNYYRLVDPDGQPVTGWIQPDSEGKITFSGLAPDTLYTVESVTAQDYNNGNPDSGDIDWLDEVYTKIPIEDTTTNGQAVAVTPSCVSVQFGNLDFENYKYYITVADTPVTVPSSGLVTGLTVGKTYTLTAEDKQTYNTSTAATFTTVAHSYAVTVKEGHPDTLTAACTDASCTARDELTITPPTRTVYGGSGSVAASLSKSAFAGQSTLPAIRYVGRDGTVCPETATAPANAGKYTASITVGGTTAQVDYAIAKATPTPAWPDDLSINTVVGGRKATLADVVLGDGFTWDVPATEIKYGTDHKYPMTYQVTGADADNYHPVHTEITVIGNDATAPTGTVTVGQTTWNKFWGNVAFGLFYKDSQKVTVTSADTESGVAKTEYYLAPGETSDFTAVSWTAYTGDFDISPNNRYVVYVKITDAAQNAVILNSDGVVLDNIQPALSGIEDGRTYYREVTVTVTDANLDKVEVNGQEAPLTDGKLTLTPHGEPQTVAAFDKAGNESTRITVTVEAEHAFLWGQWYDNQDGTHSKDALCACGAALTVTAPKDGDTVADGLEEESMAQGQDLRLFVETDQEKQDEAAVAAIQAGLDKGISAEYIDITVKAGDVPITETAHVLEIPVAFDFADKLDLAVYRSHEGRIGTLTALDARPTENFRDGTYYPDRENGILYIYSNRFSTYGAAYHTHSLAHVPEKAPTKEADGNIEHWYCAGCGKYFKDGPGKTEITQPETVVKYVESPQTGDAAHLWLWSTLMLLSALSLLGIIVTRKRKKTQ